MFATTNRRTRALQLVADGWSQRAAAKEVGVSDTTVRRWLRQRAEVTGPFNDSVQLLTGSLG
ncbi:helix-turn-helix domain-containing protein [Rhodococcus ruber]|uniref:helix-turn-helix domain-containing protein n=1 Tax=Rhodococcus ruber TaxID=1830 RepID=UPI00137823E6